MSRIVGRWRVHVRLRSREVAVPRAPSSASTPEIPTRSMFIRPARTQALDWRTTTSLAWLPTLRLAP